MTQRNSVGTTINGKAIGPTQIQYDTLQGKIRNVKGSGFKGIDAGAETAETRDIFILPNIGREFLSKTYQGDNTGESWYFDTGETDSNDIFLIDSKVDIKKVAQFANCIWYNPDWQGDPLIDTRRMDKYKDYNFGSDYNSFEMAYYDGWERVAPTPSQFGIIDLSKINLNAIQEMSDDEFIKTYKSSITAYIPESELGKVTLNPLTPAYSIAPSATLINEGQRLTTTVRTTGIATGTRLYWALSGTGINTSDFSSGALTGVGRVAANGTFSFTHTLRNDLTTEGDESLAIQLFSDTARTQQVGSIATVTLADTSHSATPSPDPITGQINLTDLGLVASDRVYGKESRWLSPIVNNTPFTQQDMDRLTNFNIEFEFNNRYIVATAVVRGDTRQPISQSMGSDWTARMVLQGTFNYSGGRLASASIESGAAQLISQSSPFSVGSGSVVTLDPDISQTGVQVSNPSSWSSIRGATSAASGGFNFTNGYSPINATRMPEVQNMLRQFGESRFFYNGWETNPFASNLI